ncbi:hypothetical protein CAEBREN_21131 [Caenorhabditis brenneri]|uniref:Uncharacterized protein n=1 Tax=Caenorhabditis brenneri TaxID=135651 RepID=G0MR37_CAEBE|nr:hypothetical protein CAEBREN_21131 [Caenorhabditis brenneri]
MIFYYFPVHWKVLIEFKLCRTFLLITIFYG